MTAIAPGTLPKSSRGSAARARMLRSLLPALSLALVLMAIAWLNPRASAISAST